MQSPELYAAVLTTAPFILLALTGSVVFGPAVSSGRRACRPSRPHDLLVDVAAIGAIAVGAGASLLVLSGLAPDSNVMRTFAAGGAGMALALTILHVLGDVLAMYRPEGPHAGA